MVYLIKMLVIFLHIIKEPVNNFDVNNIPVQNQVPNIQSEVQPVMQNVSSVNNIPTGNMMVGNVPIDNIQPNNVVPNMEVPTPSVNPNINVQPQVMPTMNNQVNVQNDIPNTVNTNILNVPEFNPNSSINPGMSNQMNTTNNIPYGNQVNSNQNIQMQNGNWKL